MVDRERAKAKLEPSRSDAPMGYNRPDIGSTPYQQAGLLAKLTGEEAEVRRIPGQQQANKRYSPPSGTNSARANPCSSVRVAVAYPTTVALAMATTSRQSEGL